MKAAMYYSQEDVRIEDLPIPKIGEEEILVEMKACGICGSDLMHWYIDSRAPLVPGHEPTGVVSEVGSRVKNFSVDDRVFVHHHAACLECHFCLRGDYTLCDQFHVTQIDPGGLADYFRVPAPNLQHDTLTIPETLTFEEATLIEPIGCCLRALKKCSPQAGDTTVIIGSGTTGIVHTALFKILVNSKVIVSDLIDYRLKIARKFGADLTVNIEEEKLVDEVKRETNGRMADIVIVTAPLTQAVREGLSVCRRGGKLCLFAPTVPGRLLRVSPKELFFSEIQIIPSYSTSHLEIREALELLESGRLKPKDLITHRYKLVDTNEAFSTALTDKESLKIIIVNR